MFLAIIKIITALIFIGLIFTGYVIAMVFKMERDNQAIQEKKK